MNMPPPNISRVPLDDAIIDVRRVVWRNAALANFHLWRDDEWAFSTGLGNNWMTNTGTPGYYSIAATRPVELQVAYPPLDVGTLELITTNAGAALNPATSATILGIPDNFSWVIKWGALADLTVPGGQAEDSLRHKFCESRWRLGVETARMITVIAAAQINGVHVEPVALADLDAGYGNWQDNSGTPVDIGIAGPNMIYARPVPDGIHSITLDVARNAPVPAADSEYVEIGRDNINTILDYAHHLAAFKMGGKEFADTFGLSENFIRQAT